MALGKKTGGRVAGTPNKATAEIKVLAGAYSAEAIEILINIARNADGDAAKVAACKELLDRGHGKAMQNTEISSRNGEGFVLNVVTGIPDRTPKVVDQPPQD